MSLGRPALLLVRLRCRAELWLRRLLGLGEDEECVLGWEEGVPACERLS